jgi:magnesium-dependent phosphatase 1
MNFLQKQLFVFDLDFTLWDAGGTWCDHTTPPYKVLNGQVFDADMSHIYLYPDVLEVLELLVSKGKQVAVASRTQAPPIAQELMRLFGINPYIKYKEIYPGSKIPHFQNLSLKSGLHFGQMVFFDDEQRNIDDVKSLGVDCVLVSNGLTKYLVERYI